VYGGGWGVGVSSPRPLVAGQLSSVLPRVGQVPGVAVAAVRVVAFARPVAVAVAVAVVAVVVAVAVVVVAVSVVRPAAARPRPQPPAARRCACSSLFYTRACFVWLLLQRRYVYSADILASRTCESGEHALHPATTGPVVIITSA
jgi:hypothetical protein